MPTPYNERRARHNRAAEQSLAPGAEARYGHPRQAAFGGGLNEVKVYGELQR
jgi:hypothetical protein